MWESRADAAHDRVVEAGAWLADEAARATEAGWDRAVDTLRTVDGWLAAHDRSLDEVTVWAMALGWLVMGLVNVALWLVMRWTRDRTDVGRPLRRKKLFEGLAECGIGTLYGLTLWAYYRSDTFGMYPRLALRLALLVSLSVAVVAGVRFAVVLVRRQIEAARGEAVRGSAYGDVQRADTDQG